MRAFIVAFDTSLSTAQFGTHGHKLTRLLRQHPIQRQTLHVRKGLRPILGRLMTGDRAALVVAIDDECPPPDTTFWLADLTREALKATRYPRASCGALDERTKEDEGGDR